jgi:hypothetical protein
VYCLCVNVYCYRVSTKCVLPPGVNPTAVDKYIKINSPTPPALCPVGIMGYSLGRTLAGGRDCGSWENPGWGQRLWIMGEPRLGVSQLHLPVSWIMMKYKINTITDKGKGKGNLVRRHLMTAYRGVEVLPHSVLALALVGVEWS